MKEYEKAFFEIREYFINLGYYEAMFENEVLLPNQLSNNSHVDFIVKQANKPYIVVEAKMAKSFDKIDSENLKYDPSVRQVQTYAMHMEAPYYVVTNGKEFLWFETDDDGRPSKIEPVVFANNNSDNALGVTINEALNICKEFLRSDARTSNFMHELILLLLARFAVKNTVAATNIPYEIDYILENNYSFDVKLISQANQKTLESCWFVLSECKPENADPKQLITALKLLAQKSKINYTYRLNEKMSEFLLKLAVVDGSQCILDPVANLGEITTTLSLKDKKNNIYSFCQSEEHYAFLALQNKIIYDDICNTHLISFQDFILKSFEQDNNLNPDLIITAFPFGSRHNLTELRNRSAINLTNIEDYLIVASLETLKTNGRLVAIVPDSMLFAGGKREQLRKYIVDRYCLRSIISLPAGTLSNSNAKTSIIVIDKADEATENVFFGIVNKTDISEKGFFTNANGGSVGLLKEYEEFIHQGFIESSGAWKCFPVDLNIDNLRAETYLTIHDSMIESKYPTYSIDEICMSVKRGTAIKNVDNGAIPFLAPAAIRPNKIDDGKLSFTNDENAKKSLVYAKRGSVVFNNISSYLGATASIDGHTPIAINQHVIALVPNSEIVLPQYLAIAINSKGVNSNILRAATGVTIPSITLKNLKEIKVPVPDLETQQNIINYVNKIQSELESLEEARNTLEEKLASVIDRLDVGEVE